jgi:hypothetical protein
LRGTQAAGHERESHANTSGEGKGSVYAGHGAILSQVLVIPGVMARTLSGVFPGGQ